jgi:hypothetical protein
MKHSTPLHLKHFEINAAAYLVDPWQIPFSMSLAFFLAFLCFKHRHILREEHLPHS